MTRVNEQDLIASMRELATSVDNLSTRVKDNLTKDEAEEIYPSKKDVNQRRTYFVIFVILSILLSNIITMATISYCFIANPGSTRAGCTLIPGYKDIEEKSSIQQAQFRELLTQMTEQIKVNGDRNDKQDAELKAIEASLKKIEAKLGI